MFKFQEQKSSAPQRFDSAETFEKAWKEKKKTTKGIKKIVGLKKVLSWPLGLRPKSLEVKTPKEKIDKPA